MTYHPGKVISVISPKDKAVKSGDETTQATIEMWDGNLFTFLVAEGLEKDVKKDSIVLVDYRPIGDGKVPIARQIIVKVLEGSLADDIWSKYEKFKDKQRKKKIPETNPIQQPSYMG